ncbi:MAG: DEAD/DEAH box helicase [Verrucomicrobiota bacterium]|nr:DEAD/DEAH box helicase [Verrucomicrobiota bacterium]
MTKFEDLALPLSVLRGVQHANFTECTPIQAVALPHALNHKDLFCQAQTGTGKTAAFLLSSFTHVLQEELDSPPSKTPGAPATLVLAPTRELALQIVADAHKLAKFTELRIVAVYGGMAYRQQVRQLEKGVDIIVATPGRLIDFIQQGVIVLRNTRIAVIDEADRMLDMGFIPDVRRILRHLPPPGARQTLLFSATLSPEVKRLAAQWTKDPIELSVNPEKLTVDNIQQINIPVRQTEKFNFLVDLLRNWKSARVLIFTNRKIAAEMLSKRLSRAGISVAFLSGDVAQNRRISILDGFKKGKPDVLVATDLASRGIHVDDISLVINYDIPYEPEAYVHRVGRTARSGKAGVAINFVCEAGGFYMADVEVLLGKSIRSLSQNELFDKLRSIPAAPSAAPAPPRREPPDSVPAATEPVQDLPILPQHTSKPRRIRRNTTTSAPPRDTRKEPALALQPPAPPMPKRSLSRRRKSRSQSMPQTAIPEPPRHLPPPRETSLTPQSKIPRGRGSRRRRNHNADA